MKEHIKGVYMVVPTKEIFDAVTWQKLRTGRQGTSSGKVEEAQQLLVPNKVMLLPQNSTATEATNREEGELTAGKDATDQTNSALFQNTAAAAAATDQTNSALFQNTAAAAAATDQKSSALFQNTAAAAMAGTEAGVLTEEDTFPDGLRQWRLLSIIDSLAPTAAALKSQNKKKRRQRR